MAVSPTPSLPATFFTHPTKSDPSFASKESQKRLSDRLRDVLIKLLGIVGGPQVLSAFIPLAAAEGDVALKSDSSTLNKKWYVKLLDWQN